MKENYLTLKDKNGDKKDYRILLNIENNETGINYVIYTDDKVNSKGEVKCYASTYEISDKGNMCKLKPVEMKEEFDFLDKVMESLEGKKND